MYLGLDIGTSSVKAVLLDRQGQPVADVAVPLKVSRPRPGWSEQDPDAWCEAVGDAVDALARDHGKAVGAVKGIGLSGQMHGATLLDAADRPLRPCILWDDTRAAGEAAELDADPRFRAITGNIVFPGFTAPKLVWTTRHEPGIAGRIARVLLPKDYVRLWLTGDHATDMSDAAGTAWLDVAARAWSSELLAATGLESSHMPALYEGSAATGTLRSELASRWGMTEAPVVAAGGGDNAAAACGIGAIAPGAAFVSLGTSGVLFVATEHFAPAPDSAVHAFCHALPGTWHQMGVILSAAGAFDWLAGVLGHEPGKLAALVEDGGGPGETVFLPYLAGERTPHNDAEIRGGFAGLSYSSDPAALARAVMEGVAFAFADCLAALRLAGGTAERATAVGGGAQSRAWLGILSNTLGITIDVPESGEFGAAFGAARLAICAAEGADPREVCTPPPIRHSIEPVPVRHGAYWEAWRRYRTLYPAIKGAMSA